jgi:hypothetical protein
MQAITKKKMNMHEYNKQEFQDMMKRLNIRIHGVQERVEIQTEGIGHLSNEFIAENFPSVNNNIDTHVQEAF